MGTRKTTAPAKKRDRKRWTKDDTELTLLSLPTVLWYLIFSYLPMFGVVIAFKEYKLAPGGHGFLYNLFASDWVGIKNFKFFFTSNAFTMLLRNTILYNIAFIIISATVAVGGALILSNMRNKTGSKIYQTMMFLPYFMSWVLRVRAAHSGERLHKRHHHRSRRREDHVVPGKQILAVHPDHLKYLEGYGIRHGNVSGKYYKYRPVSV